MQSFDDVLIGTIDEVVKNVFEEKIAEVIFQYLGEGCHKNIDDRVKFFADSLPNILGKGSVIIEDLILENLYSKLSLELKRKKSYKFADYIMELKKRTIRREDR
jgi:hypothetical protein